MYLCYLNAILISDCPAHNFEAKLLKISGAPQNKPAFKLQNTYWLFSWIISSCNVAIFHLKPDVASLKKLFLEVVIHYLFFIYTLFVFCVFARHNSSKQKLVY